MKGLLKKIRFSKKAVLITTGVLLLLGASGGAVLYIFADKVTAYEEARAVHPNGVACLDVQTEVIHEAGRLWIRKYISVDGTNGPDRARTAMRVALAIRDNEKPDLVQVAVLDTKGPTMRAELRGRAIGANVMLISNPARFPRDADASAFSARFVDGTAGPDGLFYGQRVDMLEEDVKALAASITTRDLCGNPAGGPKGDVPAVTAPVTGHGETSSLDAPASGHGTAAVSEHAFAGNVPIH
ncbi:hypothetical protein NOF55_07215 [Rhizobiaceae bacterium BDR2-2]|uniref:Uncharacterized protein n=1 Tax=Ectorhizobium quercum TaxID=2965071 RepID=A0AAE3MYN2_9HYPH|nr:hypothetical protein [Ectorhizobium quercum]MCX8996891.1 hypothetical protein [Ectorhizobium quercum]